MTQLRGAARLNAAKTHCKRRHKFNQENTYVYADGRRSCRICKNARERRRWPKVRDRRNQIKRDRRREETLKREGVL